LLLLFVLQVEKVLSREIAMISFQFLTIFNSTL